MKKTSSKIKNLHDEFTDCLEHIATYGMDSLDDKERLYAQKLYKLAEEYISIVDDENLNEDEDDVLDEE